MATALLNKGRSLARLSRAEGAIAAYHEVVERFGDAQDPAILLSVVKALAYQGGLLWDVDRQENAIAIYDDLRRRFGETSDRTLVEAVAIALFGRCLALGALNRSTEELAGYDEIVERFGAVSGEPAIEWVAKARLQRALRLQQANRYEEAVAGYDDLVRSIDQASPSAILDLMASGQAAELLAQALVNQGLALSEIGRWDEAIAACDEVARRSGRAAGALAGYVASALQCKACALCDSWTAARRRSRATRTWWNASAIAASRRWSS